VRALGANLIFRSVEGRVRRVSMVDSKRKLAVNAYFLKRDRSRAA